MFKKLRLNRAISNIVEDKLYEMALEEVEKGILKKGVWARALSQSDGIDAKAKSIYLKFRVEAMKNEAQVVDAILEDMKKEEKKQIPKSTVTINKEVKQTSKSIETSNKEVKQGPKITETTNNVKDVSTVGNYKSPKPTLGKVNCLTILDLDDDVKIVKTKYNHVYYDVKHIAEKTIATEYEIEKMIHSGDIMGITRDGGWFVHRDSLSELQVKRKSGKPNSLSSGRRIEIKNKGEDEKLSKAIGKFALTRGRSEFCVSLNC